MSRIAYRYRARALGPLRAIDWAIPAGVSLVVGPNRVGKSTLLRLPELATLMLNEGVHVAFNSVFEGVPHLRNLSVPASSPMSFGIMAFDAEWEVELKVRAGQIVDFPAERVRVNGQDVLWRRVGSEDVEGEGCRFPLSKGLLPTLVLPVVKGISHIEEDGELAPGIDESVRKFLPSDIPELIVRATRAMVGIPLAMFALSYRTYHYDLDHLLRFGSLHSSALELRSTGENVFPLLRNWRDNPKLEERYEFVLATMREIFPHLGRVGFEQAGQTVTMVVSDRRWPGDASIPIARESTGFITALLQLCALASCPQHGLVTLDEIETSLHPRAIRILVEACRRWAAKHDLRVVLATQSETVLDQFRDEPSQVFVFEPQQDTSPKPLTELFSPEYLSQFSLGDLFAHLEFGGDTTDEPAP